MDPVADAGGQFLAGVLFVAAGLGLIRFRRPLATRLARFYRRLGLDVPDERYALQFRFIGILAIVLGVLTAFGFRL